MWRGWSGCWKAESRDWGGDEEGRTLRMQFRAIKKLAMRGAPIGARLTSDP
jgi:hypothetical protein